MNFIRFTESDGQVIFLSVNVIATVVCDAGGRELEINANSLKSGRDTYKLKGQEAASVIEQLEKLLPEFRTGQPRPRDR